MEDNNFWDELAKRLRQEQPQPFEEEDWTAVHRQLRVQRKRRAGWLWPLLIALVFLANNLVWWLLWPYGGQHINQPSGTGAQRDTVYLIQERTVRDTVWQYTTPITSNSNNFAPTPASGSHLHSLSDASNLKDQASNPGLAAPEIATILPPSTLENPVIPATRWTGSKICLPLSCRPVLPASPIRAMLAPGIRTSETTAKRSLPVFATVDGGYGWFVASGASAAYTRQFGASVSILPGPLGAVAGLRRWNARENPQKKAAVLGLPDECENCPANGYPDQVRLHWMEFQLGLVYRLPLPTRKTNLYLSALGQWRSRTNQYRHFYFEQYNGPPIVVEDRYRERPGLYWNGWTGKVAATHRLKGRLGLYGSLEGRWPFGASPRLSPASAGLNLGLAWYFSD